MRTLTSVLFMQFMLFSFAQELNGIELITDTSFEKLVSTEDDYCLAAEKYETKATQLSDSSAYYFVIADRFAQRCGDLVLISRISNRMANEFSRIGENTEAHTHYTNALAGFMQLSDTARVAKIHKAIGVNYKRMSRFIDALKSFNTAAHYFHLLNDLKGIATIELNIGNIHKNMKRYDEAKAKYHSAMNLFQQLNDHELIADCQNNLGNIFKNEANNDSAFHYMYLTLISREKYGPDRKLGFIYHNLANLHLNINQFDSATYYLDQSIALKQKLGNNIDLSSDYYVYGDLYRKKGNYSKAIASYEKARKLAIGLNRIDLDFETSLKLAQVYYQSSDYKKSAENFTLHFQQRDTLRLKNDPFKIENELILYEFLKDSIETEKLELERELQEAKYKNKELSNQSIRSRLYFIIGILALIVLMIVSLLISFRKRLKQGKEHRTILALQNEELKRTLVSKEEKETLLKEIHHRVKNNLQIISSLIRLQSGYINQYNFQERLNEIENRILSMALIHEKLYQSNDLSKLEVKAYIKDLSINILESYQTKKKVRFTFDIDASAFTIDTLIPLGLILNEVISNSLKHAFYDRDEGIINIVLSEVSASETKMLISDNGIGSDLTLEELKEDSLGMDLIYSLTEQLDGNVEIQTSDGFTYHFSFPSLTK